jgi:hypothetical protein
MEDRNYLGFCSERYRANCPKLGYAPMGEVASQDGIPVQGRNPLINVERSKQEVGDRSVTKSECEHQLMQTLRENCDVIKRLVEGSCPSMLEEIYKYSPQTGVEPNTAYNNGAKSGSAPDLTQFAATSSGISAPCLLRMFEEVMVCLDQIDLAIDQDAVEGIQVDHSSHSPESTSRTRKFGPGSSLRLLSAELRLKAAIVASAAGSVRAKLEHSNGVRARLAAAADSLAEQLAHERQHVAALRAKADSELARATTLEAEVRRLKVELESATRQVALAEEKVSMRPHNCTALTHSAQP